MLLLDSISSLKVTGFKKKTFKFYIFKQTLVFTFFVEKEDILEVI